MRTRDREAFTTDPIVLVQNYQSEPVWLRKMDVYWDGPPSMTTRAVISQSYPHLANFFFKKLGITSAPPYALIDELRTIAAHHQHAVPPEVQAHIVDILVDITRIMHTMPAMPVSFHDLAQMAIFPTSVPGEGNTIALRTAEEFYVPDKSPGKYAQVFRERVALLAIPEAAVMRIRPLLESAVFRDRVRYLEDHVNKRSTPVGKHVLEPKATDLYSSRVEYFARCSTRWTLGRTNAEICLSDSCIIMMLIQRASRSAPKSSYRSYARLQS